MKFSRIPGEFSEDADEEMVEDAGHADKTRRLAEVGGAATVQQAQPRLLDPWAGAAAASAAGGVPHGSSLGPSVLQGLQQRPEPPAERDPAQGKLFAAISGELRSVLGQTIAPLEAKIETADGLLRREYNIDRERNSVSCHPAPGPRLPPGAL